MESLTIASDRSVSGVIQFAGQRRKRYTEPPATGMKVKHMLRDARDVSEGGKFSLSLSTLDYSMSMPPGLVYTRDGVLGTRLITR